MKKTDRAKTQRLFGPISECDSAVQTDFSDSVSIFFPLKELR